MNFDAFQFRIVRTRLISLRSLALVIALVSLGSSCDQNKKKEKKEDPVRGKNEGKARDGHGSQIEIGKEFVALLVKSKFQEAEKHFNQKMKTALPAERLAATWKSVEQSLGGYEKIVETKTEHKGDLTAVIMTTKFAKGYIDIRVVFNKKNQVGGLFFKPAEPKDSSAWKKPEYAKVSSFLEVDVKVESGEWVLPGTLTLPKAASEKSVCGAVLVHGSGPHDRDETIPPNKPFKDLAWGLASHGIAVLRYDKRTFAQKEKMAEVAEKITIKEESIDDAVAGVKLLRARKEISPDCVVVIGHSLGGYVAPLVGKDEPAIGGLVLLAANTRPLQDLLISQYKYLFSLDGEISEEEKKTLSRLKKSVALLKNPEKLANTKKEDLPLGIPAPYWQALLQYDPIKTAETLSMPMLILQGERDYQVTMEDFAGWKKSLPDRKNVTFKSYPKLNHLFMPGEGKSKPDEYKNPGNISLNVIKDIASFINGLSKPSNS